MRHFIQYIIFWNKLKNIKTFSNYERGPRLISHLIVYPVVWARKTVMGTNNNIIDNNNNNIYSLTVLPSPPRCNSRSSGSVSAQRDTIISRDVVFTRSHPPRVFRCTGFEQLNRGRIPTHIIYIGCRRYRAQKLRSNSHSRYHWSIYAYTDVYTII